ncbi:MAG: thioredoxin family protein, partial [Lachnospiraceae bacterium]
MALFGFGKKKEEELVQCDCGGNSAIKVLGSGCAKCNALETAAVEALKELGMSDSIDHVTDFTQ